MDPVERAIWFVEQGFGKEISLEGIAAAAGVSRFHMARAFGAATGHSVMRYVRGRRLSEAARALAAGAPDILAVALDAGYGSHEAFTRAFRDQFGITPEQLRAQGSLDPIELMEPIRVDKSMLIDLEEPRFEDGSPLLIAGIGVRYTCETNQGIPAQWQRFGPHIGNIPRQVGDVAYGLCCNYDNDDSFEYVTGVEVSDFSDVPEGFSSIRVPAQKYAVFTHREHVSAMRRTVSTIWSKWLPESRYKVADAPNFERYDNRFDPRTGTGVVEIWVPLNI
jgi:AraC family transcriptional regulator